MSDEAARHFEQQPEQPSVTSDGKSVTLSITLQPTGEIQFQLPAGNKILAYGLLEVARAQLDKAYLIDELKRQAPPPRGGIDGLLKKIHGG